MCMHQLPHRLPFSSENGPICLISASSQAAHITKLVSRMQPAGAKRLPTPGLYESYLSLMSLKCQAFSIASKQLWLTVKTLIWL